MTDADTSAGSSNARPSRFLNLGTFAGERKAALDFNPFFPAEGIARRRREEEARALKNIAALLAVTLVIFTIALFTGAA